MPPFRLPLLGINLGPVEIRLPFVPLRGASGVVNQACATLQSGDVYPEELLSLGEAALGVLSAVWRIETGPLSQVGIRPVVADLMGALQQVDPDSYPVHPDLVSAVCLGVRKASDWGQGYVDASVVSAMATLDSAARAILSRSGVTPPTPRSGGWNWLWGLAAVAAGTAIAWVALRD